MVKLQRGDIFYANLDFLDGLEKKGINPVLILDNPMSIMYKTTVICAVVADINKPMTISTNIIHTIDKKRLRERIDHLDNIAMAEVEKELKIILCLGEA